MLIIYSHPNKNGHAGAILNEVRNILSKSNINFDIIDLYEIKYDPVLHNNEHYTSGGNFVSEDNKKIQERIKNEDRFIFIYPTWWNNVPAILKGFIDRIFIRGFAFEYVNKIPRGLLRGRAVIFSSTGGPKIYSRLIAKDRALKVITKDTLKFCGIKSRSYSVGSANQLNDKQISKINKMVNGGIKYLIK